MSNQGILTIGFDGLNRSGKRTQIELLMTYLTSQHIPFIVTRGDGTRSGRGLHPYDFPSKWWIENRENLLELNTEDVRSKLNLQFQRLCRESHVQRHRLSKQVVGEANQGVMIFDRTFISRYFTMRQYFPQISLEEALYCYNPRNKKKVEPIIPDLTFLLYVSKQTLLSRIEQTDKGTPRFPKVYKYVSDHFELFNKTVEDILTRGYNVQILNAEDAIEEVHRKVIRIYKNVRAK